jgi:hypothetical protein
MIRAKKQKDDSFLLSSQKLSFININNSEDLINELMDIIENPENSNEVWKKMIIGKAKEEGYGHK